MIYTGLTATPIPSSETQETYQGSLASPQTKAAVEAAIDLLERSLAVHKSATQSEV